MLIHEFPFSFAATHLDTIHPVEIKGTQMPEIGQRIRLSDGDIAQTNLLYKCPSEYFKEMSFRMNH